MAENTNRPGGIACPACGIVENYAGKTNEKRIDDSIYRKKQCKSCGNWFDTIEVPIGVVEVKRRSRNSKEENSNSNP